MAKRKTVKAWHFTRGHKLRDGRPVPAVGEWLIHEGSVSMCSRGLHASRKLLDAMRYAPGWTLHRVQCQDVRADGGDKIVCTRRRIVVTLPADRAKHVILLWARACAWSVIDTWKAPDVVRRWLETGDPAMRPQARCAAYAAYAADAYAYAAYAAAAAADAYAYAYAADAYAYAAAAAAADAYAYAAAAAADAYAAAVRVNVKAALGAELERMILREMGK